MGLTKEQVDSLIIIERVTASISVFSTLFLLTTFVFIKAFRTLSNTLIFYASFANLFANVAALIGGSALGKLSSPLCQFQGFLLEMFMQSDPMWSLAMAVNVYLVFFRRYDSTRLKKLYWLYGVICYGLPFIPAMVCLFLKTHKKGKIYGNATLWCWIDNEWAPLRIYSYYAPIWVAILCALIIYVRVGIEIFQKRSQLRAAAADNSATMNSVSGNGTIKPIEPFTGLRTTEIEVTHDPWSGTSLASPTAPATAYSRPKGAKENYSITINATVAPDAPRTPGLFVRRPSSMDKVKWAYTKVAVLFAASILITWVPASANRVYGLRFPNNPSYALNVCSALVLPLQGFWNTVIFFTTSLGICRSTWANFRRGSPRKFRTGNVGFHKMDIVHLGGRRDAGNKESDSMVELSTSRSLASRGESF